ncbi:peptidase S41 [Porphyromonas macacae]|uniref:C-terminal processing peptidase n=1 Tax=Porphyromonas macacae TaxID=28115 RepID=A0A0A2E7W7_9PORP|nr:S41 family peptidase [Porphyromonas macacae]KGN74988.1 peptidase S41 [Porphyromonas macacae]KGN99906.1 peptidase S41 [Porphyromonas macacae]SUB89175.1 C-terminal processing peptidase [Porphyromonas macacae]
MTRKIFTYSLVCLLISMLFSCSTEKYYTEDPKENFDMLWEILDRNYCFFDEKLPANTTWRDMYDKHVAKIHKKMGVDSLFLVMTQLMAELKDGHVNLYSNFDIGRYWNWREDYPSNYSREIIDEYLEKDYHIAGSAFYRYLKYNGHAKDSIGYIRYSSFSGALSHSNLNAMLSRLAFCKGLIIDIRDNGGGNLTTSDVFLQHFLPERMLTGYISHKKGPGHNDFSDPLPIYVDTLKYGVKWFRPVVVLTNRGVFSSANDFVMKMKPLKLVTIMGDKTGGGAGLPASSELPIGWAVRYSSSRMTDANFYNVEFGIEPEIKVSLKDEDKAKKIDTLIEEAIAHINKIYKKKGQ